MQSIAVSASVGQGTLYRHFPSREALLLEVYREDFAGLIARADMLVQSLPARLALRRWLDELAVFGRKKHALTDVLDAATRAELHDEQYGPILVAIVRVVSAGQAVGDLRPDLRADELLPLVSFLWHLDTSRDPRIPRLLDFRPGPGMLWRAPSRSR